MAKYYPLNYASFGSDLQAALEDYYGNGVTMLKVETLGVTFSCPQICDKPVKISTRILNSAYEAKSLDCYVYPDETLASGVKLMNFTYYYPGTFYGHHLVLSPKFLLIQAGHTDREAAFSILVARASNGRSLFVTGTANASEESNARCLYTDKMAVTQIRMEMMATGNAFVSGKQYLLKPVFFGEEYILDMNDDGSLAYIDGLYSCGKYEANQPHIGSNYYLSVSGIRGPVSYGTYAPGTFYIALDE